MAWEKNLVCGVLLAGVSAAVMALGSGSTAESSARGAQEVPPKANEKLIYSLKGPDLFRHHCAPCHGADGKGAGPVAPALKAKLPDLTLLAKRNGGKFPVERTRKMLADDALTTAHGSREMPVWGPIFHQIEDDQDYGAVRVENLVKYLESMQQK